MNIFKKIFDLMHRNVIVEATYLSVDGNKHDCIGVLIKEDANTIKIAFNAKDNVVMDSIEIPKAKVLEIKRISNDNIITYK